MYYNIGKSERYLAQIQSQTKSIRIKPEVHCVSKNLDPSIQPEKQSIKPLKRNEILQEKPGIGKGRAGMRRKPPINQTIAQSAEPSKEIPETSKIEKKVINQPHFTTPVQSINNSSADVINRRPMIKDIPFKKGKKI